MIGAPRRRQAEGASPPRVKAREPSQ
jgi:hypothetical protein